MYHRAVPDEDYDLYAHCNRRFERYIYIHAMTLFLFLLAQSIDRGAHGLSRTQCRKRFLINLSPLRAQVNDFFQKRRRHDHDSVAIRHQYVLWVDPEISLELQGDIDL